MSTKNTTLILTINGETKTVRVEAGESLASLLRRKGLAGVKIGCNQGSCGACSVILNGRLVNSCMITAAQYDGAEILTVEGLAQGTDIHPIQKAFIDSGAVQCGYCTPGMVLAAKYLLERNPEPQEADVRDGLSGNLCRCTGYTKIFDSVMLAADVLKNLPSKKNKSKSSQKKVAAKKSAGKGSRK